MGRGKANKSPLFYGFDLPPRSRPPCSSGKTCGESWGQLGRKTPPLRYEIRERRRVRPTDSTGLMVGAVGIEFAVNLISPVDSVALASLPPPKCNYKAAFCGQDVARVLT